MQHSHRSPRLPVRGRTSPPERDVKVFLKPGELWIADSPTLVKTILGSCLAITMRAPRLGLASMTHCLLPSAGDRPEGISREEALKYVDTTIGILFAAFAAHGAAIREFEVKLIGGADNLLATTSPSRYAVGSRNVETALEGLAARGVTPSVTIVGGRIGRVMVFDSGTGDVFVRQLSPTPPAFWEES